LSQYRADRHSPTPPRQPATSLNRSRISLDWTLVQRACPAPRAAGALRGRAPRPTDGRTEPRAPARSWPRGLPIGRSGAPRLRGARGRASAADAVEHRPQRCGGNRFRQEIVHAGSEAGFAIRLPGPSGRRDDVQVTACVALALPDGLDHLETVDLGQV